MKKIIYKTPDQIDNIRESWKYLTELLKIIYENSKPWIVLLELEEIAQNYINKNQNISWAFKWYMWYPANLCLSVNDCLVHGIPDNYVLKDWDLLKIDAWITYKRWISDAAVSLIIWWDDKNPIWANLIKSTKDSLDSAIKYVKPYNSIYNYSNEIYLKMKNNWFAVIKLLTWHWVGENVHEWPFIYNRPYKETVNIKFQPNMVLALEPITAEYSTDFTERWNNKRNLYTKWWDLWAQWEYTIVINKESYEILAWIV